MITAIPPKKPIITGRDRKSPTQPSLPTPITRVKTPTRKAVTRASPMYSAVSSTRPRPARPAARIGATVLSTPRARWRLVEMAAPMTVATRNPYSPVIGGIPARWAVASCPGIVTAPNVTPATRSRPSHWRR